MKTLSQQIKKNTHTLNNLFKSYFCWNKLKVDSVLLRNTLRKPLIKYWWRSGCFSGSSYISYKKLNPSHVLAVILYSIALKHFGESSKMKGPIWFFLCSSKVQKQKSNIAVFKPKPESFTHWRAFVLKRSSSGCSRLSSSRTT